MAKVRNGVFSHHLDTIWYGRGKAMLLSKCTFYKNWFSESHTLFCYILEQYLKFTCQHILNILQTKPGLIWMNQTNCKLSARLTNTLWAPNITTKWPLYVMLTEWHACKTPAIKQQAFGEGVWANAPVLIKFLIISCWVNWSEHGKLLHFQFLIYVALPTQTISIGIRRHFLSRRECMDWTIQQFIMLGWNCLIITSILWTKYCKLYQTTNATHVCTYKMWPHTQNQNNTGLVKSPCAPVQEGNWTVLQVEVSYIKHYLVAYVTSHVPVGFTSSTYCNHK